MTKRYRITLFESSGGTAVVTAATAAKARRIAEGILEADGLAGFDDFSASDRDYGVLGVEEERP